jgi:hypothetical protein
MRILLLPLVTSTFTVSLLKTALVTVPVTFAPSSVQLMLVGAAGAGVVSSFLDEQAAVETSAAKAAIRNML